MAGTAAKSAPGELLLPGAILLASAAVIQLSLDGRLAGLALGPAAPTKPFGSFEAFYPHYLKEHSLPGTRLLHYIGTCAFVALLLATHPGLALCMLAALAAGVAVFPFLRAVPHGLFEFAVMLGVYLLTGSRLVGSVRRAALPVVVAYSAAWVGHFFIERNRPATFIYPPFSLMGDFAMLFGAVQAAVRGRA